MRYVLWMYAGACLIVARMVVLPVAAAVVKTRYVELVALKSRL